MTENHRVRMDIGVKDVAPAYLMYTARADPLPVTQVYYALYGYSCRSLKAHTTEMPDIIIVRSQI